MLFRQISWGKCLLDVRCEYTDRDGLKSEKKKEWEYARDNRSFIARQDKINGILGAISSENKGEIVIRIIAFVEDYDV